MFFNVPVLTRYSDGSASSVAPPNISAGEQPEQEKFLSVGRGIKMPGAAFRDQEQLGGRRALAGHDGIGRGIGAASPAARIA